MLHEPDYLNPLFEPLLQMPRHSRRLLDSAKYAMPANLADQWSKLESDLSMATYLLQAHYDAPAIRPMYPSGFGYKKSHFHESAAMKSIRKAKDWFSVWLALLSFLIAMAETKEHELRDYPHLSKGGWADYLLEHGAERTWVECVINSVVFRFQSSVVRSGVFLHLL